MSTGLYAVWLAIILLSAILADYYIYPSLAPALILSIPIAPPEKVSLYLVLAGIGSIAGGGWLLQHLPQLMSSVLPHGISAAGYYFILIALGATSFLIQKRVLGITPQSTYRDFLDGAWCVLWGALVVSACSTGVRQSLGSLWISPMLAIALARVFYEGESQQKIPRSTLFVAHGLVVAANFAFFFLVGEVTYGSLAYFFALWAGPFTFRLVADQLMWRYLYREEISP